MTFEKQISYALGSWIQHYVIYDRSVVFSTNKSDRLDITKILLKVSLNSITLTPSSVMCANFQIK